MDTIKGTTDRPEHISEMAHSTNMDANRSQNTPDTGNGSSSHKRADYLHVFDSRTCNIHHIPVSDGFVRGSDLGKITAPVKGSSGRLQKLAVLDPGFQHTACKESAITLM